MSKVMLAIVTINLGLMGAARLPFPHHLPVAATQPAIVVHPTPSPTASPEFPSVPSPEPVATEREVLAATVTRCQNFAGANFRTVPSLDNAAIANVIPCNTAVVLTGNSIRGDGEVWLEAEWNGDRGWVAQVMLSPPQRVRVREAISPAPVAPLPQRTRSNLVQVRYGL
ncbi:hypothetical protein ACN4EK_05725 [Pantanalinema rosaneae CENA516]|uniref:hypothetical protein n=1 Tax=Pantanalinema rosaneae TaxID=1620701 RepID=UPI003D6E937A